MVARLQAMQTPTFRANLLRCRWNTAVGMLEGLEAASRPLLWSALAPAGPLQGEPPLTSEDCCPAFAVVLTKPLWRAVQPRGCLCAGRDTRGG
eukprot:1158272-Pelagomonas_calceolata.AAC.3